MTTKVKHIVRINYQAIGWSSHWTFKTEEAALGKVERLLGEFPDPSAKVTYETETLTRQRIKHGLRRPKLQEEAKPDPTGAGGGTSVATAGR